MTRLSDSKALALAGVFLSISAAMHLSAIIVAGLHFSTFLFLVIGLIYLSIARTYLGRSDLWTWPGLILMGIGIPGALIMIHFGSAVPNWWLWPIVVLDVAVVLSLLWFLWRR
ncbi:MAG: hypothetical protein HKN30_06835 [Sulfitobacter sp.]|nr:hypothetical protein [Sulfitobacter sp.]